MEILTVGEAIDLVAEVGGSLQLEGDQVSLSLPQNCPPDAESAILASARANRDALAALLREMASKAPPLEEVKASLPAGVRLVSYQPKEAPFPVALTSLVTNAGRFYRAYLRDLKARLEKPEGYHCLLLPDIFNKLADAGLELAFEPPAAREKGSASNAER
jgi:hypothetical protein